MARRLAWLVLVFGTLAAGCSLILDFSVEITDAAPADALPADAGANDGASIR